MCFRTLSFSHPGAWQRIWVCTLLGIHTGLLGWGAVRQSLTVDEPVHLSSGLRRLEEGRFDLNRGNPPLVGTVAALPVLFAQPKVDWHRAPHSADVAEDFVAANGARSFWLITLGRMACIPFSILAACVCFRWARELYGAASGFLALTLWCFCPEAIAHGQLITGDMAATALGFAAFYAFWKWLQKPSLERSAVAGMALGLAELAKYVCVVLYLLWPLLWVVWRLLRPRATPRRPWLREAAYGLFIVVLSTYIINFGYLFSGSFQPLEQFHVGTRLLEHLTVAPGITRWVAELPVPLPADYVGGIDEIQQVAESRPLSYLCGEFRPDGWWYAYLCELGVKLPLGTLNLLGLACVVFLAKGYNRDWRTEVLVLLVIASLLCFVTCSNTVMTVRYVLPVLPFLLLWVSKSGQAFSKNDRLVSVLVVACLSWSVLSSLWIYPHSLSYFNEVTGGPLKGHEWLADSHIDWGQDLFYLKAWLAKHPEAKPLHLAYFGRVDPRLAGIEYSLPNFDPAGTVSDERADSPGWYAISVNLLRGLVWPVPDGKGGMKTITSEYLNLLHFRPVAMAGYSICIFHISREDVYCNR
jgi:4-amino-4-deoxy-L-arabinose transferase-like glycosyltransferase